MRVQVSIANTPLGQVVAGLKPAMLGGTAITGLGFGEPWPDEPSVLVVGTVDGLAGLGRLQLAVAALLRKQGESAAWLEADDGKPGRLVQAAEADEATATATATAA